MDIMKPVVVTLSTPRCGTQWLAQTIRDLHGDAVVAEHEPLENQYLLRKFFRRFESIDEQLNVEAIRDHIARINDITRSKIYIEVGYQACAAIPLFIREFQERIRIIHLYRNPVLTAYSMVTLGYYKFRSPEDEQQNVLSMLDPRQDHVAFRDYAAKWQNMSPFARSLYFWLEINQYAQELRQRYSGIPFLAVRSEDMFASADHLAAVLRWIGLPEDDRSGRRRLPVQDPPVFRDQGDHENAGGSRLGTAHGLFRCGNAGRRGCQARPLQVPDYSTLQLGEIDRPDWSLSNDQNQLAETFLVRIRLLR
jgi:hypothetical protein